MIATTAPASAAGFPVAMPPRGAFRRFAAGMMTAFATARMAQALRLFPDDQLAALGITRRDIDAHAARLVGAAAA